MRITAASVTATRALAVACALGAVTLAGGCGDSGTEAPAPGASAAPSDAPAPAVPAGPSQDQLDVVTVIQQYQVAVDKGDAKGACALMSKDLKFVYSQDPGAGNCERAIENLHKQLAEHDHKLANTRVNAQDVEVKGSMAVLSRDAIAKSNGLKPDQAESFDMVKVGGKWLIDYIS